MVLIILKLQYSSTSLVRKRWWVYLSRDKVIGFLAHPTLALLKWRAHFAGVCLIYRSRKEKRRLSKKRRTVKRNPVQRIQRSHKCLAKVAQKGNHLFFWIVWGTLPEGPDSQDRNFGSLVTRKRSACFHDFFSCVLVTLYFVLCSKVLVERWKVKFWICLQFSFTLNPQNITTIIICLAFNLLRSVLSQNGIAIAIGNYAPRDSLTDIESWIEPWQAFNIPFVSWAFWITKNRW